MGRIVLITCVILTMCGAVCGFTGSGSGTIDDPYIITNVYQLKGISDELDAHYVLANDIDASDTVNWNDGQGFEPILGVTDEGVTLFSGTFNGQGYTITDLFINRPSDSLIGLFAAVGVDSKIENVTLTNVDITGYEFVGSIIGAVSGGDVSNCHSSGKVECIYWYGGGLCGFMKEVATVTDCSSSCSVSGYRYTGGFCGGMQGTVTKCNASGDVFGSYGYAGGFVGKSMSGSMNRCNATGTVTSTISNAGGFIGGTGGDEYVIDQCYATGNVVSSSSQIGGFIGDNTSGVIKNCYATGGVRGSTSIGGFVGLHGGLLQNCYSTGKVTSSSGSSRIGGFCGTNNSTIAHSYYDTQTSGRSDTGKGIPRTTSQMMHQATFAGWDFDEIWYVDEGMSYPALQCMLAPPPSPTPITIDIKPGSCINPVNVKSNGVLAVAIHGTADFDAFAIDPLTINLAGVRPIRSSFSDVSSPAVEGQDCPSGPDGIMDIVLKFKTQEIIAALGDMTKIRNKTDLSLTLTCKLMEDETVYEGSDIVRVIKPKRSKRPQGPRGPKGPQNNKKLKSK